MDLQGRGSPPPKFGKIIKPANSCGFFAILLVQIMIGIKYFYEHLIVSSYLKLELERLNGTELFGSDFRYFEIPN